MTHDIDSSKIVGGLGAYVTELDSLRPPIMFGATPLSSTVFLELLFKWREKSYFIKNNRELNRKVLRKMHEYRTDTNVDLKEMQVPIIVLSVSMLSILAISLGIAFIYSVSLVQYLLISMIIGLPIVYLSLAFSVMKRRSGLGERHDEALKRSVQSLIDFGVQFTENNSLNPDMFPIKLQHDDYDGLIYKKMGKNNYVGVFEK